MGTIYRYIGYRFRQRPGGPSAVLFLAPAEQVSDWAGVPRKSASFMKGFQRAVDDTHVEEITDYFDRPENISPTAVVVAFKPDTLVVKTLKPFDLPEATECIGEPVLLEVSLDDMSSLSVEQLASESARILRRQHGEIADAADDDDADTDDEEQPTDEEPAIQEEEPLAIGTSHLKRFIESLESPEWVASQKATDEAQLRSTLQDLLKPATIVDGQHRTRGASFLEQQIPFPVVGLVDTSWPEEVFQFVVINQRAKPIKPEFLSAIISSSLSNSDIEGLKARLEQAGVNLLNTRIADMLHSSPESPFFQMIDFKVQGAEGKMKYSGMLALAKRFRKLRTHDSEVKFAGFFKQVFQPACSGANYSERRAHWLDQRWFEFFTAFWTEVRSRICDVDKGDPSLWVPGTNLLKIVTLQELQNLFLYWLADRRDPVVSIPAYETFARQFLSNLNQKFFNREWKLTSLQSETGRKYLRSALTNALRDPAYKFNDPLFKGISA